jgi:small-conductance mechanosensitive channel
MITSNLRDILVQKLDDLEPEKLGSVIDYVDSLLYQQQSNRNQSKNPKTTEERMIVVEELKQLFKETQAIHADNPLTDEEITAEIEAYRRGE